MCLYAGERGASISLSLGRTQFRRVTLYSVADIITQSHFCIEVEHLLIGKPKLLELRRESKAMTGGTKAVSYTHLTLPTKRIV